MPIVGTAGHVDHGKSTLVQALTGRDPDRWAEEKERGLTIDLGFAWTELASGHTVGFVDVPGHERFMKNMLAGVGALDVALFVVAADEGWMPQTEEHLSVLDLLDVRHGVIALSRADLADADTLELAELEITEQTERTAMAAWPVIPVSPVTGLGMDELRSALVAALEAAGPPDDLGAPRLWVDRSFVISGAGVVVTGTLTGGSLTRGDQLVIYPAETDVRVRGLQSHERDTDIAVPGTRTAVNLAGIDRSGATRGDLLARPDSVSATKRVLVELRTVRSLTEPLTSKGAFHLHLGSGTWPARLRPVGDAEIHESGWALVDLESDLPVTMGDRFILREVGKRAVVAGGRIIDPRPTGRLGDLAASAPALGSVLDDAPAERAQALLEARGFAALADLARDSGGGVPTRALVSAEHAITEKRATSLMAEAADVVRTYQRDNPLRDGAPKASLATSLRISPELFDLLLANSDQLVDDGATVRTADFTARFGEREESAWADARHVLAGSLAVPRAGELELDAELLHALVRSGRLVRVSDDLVYLPEQVDAIVAGLARLEDGFTVAMFRDEFELTRRQAVPLLEWLDAAGYTRRRGDTREVRKRPG